MPGLLPMTRKQATVSVLFVCMGNICRSPTGEGVFRQYVERQGRADRFHVDSAGTIDYHSGAPADGRMRKAAARRGYVLDSIARQVRPEDLDRFDLVVAMDRNNLRDLEQLAGGPRANLRLLGSFLPERDAAPGPAPDVPDPYYGGPQGFEEVLDMIERACPHLFSVCQETLNSK